MYLVTRGDTFFKNAVTKDVKINNGSTTNVMESLN